MPTHSPMPLNRRWALSLEQGDANVAESLMNLGLSPHDVIDGVMDVATETSPVMRSKSLWRWAARAPHYASMSALTAGVEAQWAMRPDLRQASFVEGFRQPWHEGSTSIVRLHQASSGLLPAREDGWALDEAMVWKAPTSLHNIIWLNQMMTKWAAATHWDDHAVAPWGGPVGDRASFLRQGWAHSVLTAGDPGAWVLPALESLGVVAPGEWDFPLRMPGETTPTTLLQEAARLAQPELVDALLQGQANPNLANVEGITPLGFITSHLLEAPEQKMPELVNAWIKLLEAGASLETELPWSETRGSAVFHSKHGRWMETAPNNDWTGQPVGVVIAAWLQAQQTVVPTFSSGPSDFIHPVDGFRRTAASIEQAARLGRALEGHQLRATWETVRAANPTLGKTGM